MIDAELLKALAPLGVGGILAAVIFWFYHRAFMNERAGREIRSRALLETLTANSKAMEQVAQAVQSLSAAVQGFEAKVVREIEHSVRSVIAEGRGRT